MRRWTKCYPSRFLIRRLLRSSVAEAGTCSVSSFGLFNTRERMLAGDRSCMQ